MENFEQNLHISDNAFEGMRHDADRVLQKLLKNMVEKESMEGSVTIKIDITLTQEFIANHDPNVAGETRKILIPAFTHKVGSMMQIKDEAKGGINYEGCEMVWDDDLKEYVVKPVANTTQRTIFDDDFCVNDAEYREVEDEDAEPALEGRLVAALPGPATEESEDQEGDETVSDDEADEEAEDLSEVFGEEEEITPQNMPFAPSEDDDEYEYEEPEEF